MPKLYYTPTSCGASSFISCFVAGITFDCETVDLSTHLTNSSVDFYTINPKGNVPALVLDDGTVLNENISCLEYISDLSNLNNCKDCTCGKKISPESGTTDAYLVKQALSYIASELHATIGLFFNPSSKEEKIREFIFTIFEKKMAYLQKHIIKEDSSFVVGDSFSTADAYLHIVLSWTKYLGIDLSNYPVAYTYYNKICELEQVKLAKNRIESNPSTTF